ncbi:hypothetical protein F2Q70_00003296 [Brassica cretica]|uniref:Uncharacterized protein n=2 Tax=Brassica cretica TaxID=69181 RepID=A0A3N6Q4A4_BRACR|nr:hypothetical protein F2Q68_00020831 [Brassica cretica]KAF2570209.1 hypothetical protein F2Q70_00003296 [Brassica cretica]KAF3567954.1 hypothetical protein DY000_02015048 [Brassica cretica]
MGLSSLMNLPNLSVVWKNITVFCHVLKHLPSNLSGSDHLLVVAGIAGGLGFATGALVLSRLHPFGLEQRSWSMIGDDDIIDSHSVDSKLEAYQYTIIK